MPTGTRRQPVAPDIEALDGPRPFGNPEGGPAVMRGDPVHRPSVAPVAAIPPFYVQKPPNGKDLTSRARGVLPAGAGATVTLVDVNNRFKTSNQTEGVVASVLVFVQAPTPLVDVTFQLLINNGPVPGFSNLGVPQVTANGVLIAYDGAVIIEANSEATARVINNSAAGPWNVEVTLAGWYWAIRDRVRVFGSLL
jgi:hypothetical protein